MCGRNRDNLVEKPIDKLAAPGCAGDIPDAAAHQACDAGKRRKKHPLVPHLLFDVG